MQKLAEADERPGLFLELDLRSGWQRDELSGKVRLLTDYHPGGVRKKGEVTYDRLGRRILERSLDERGWLIFERRWNFDRPGFAPKSMAVLDANGVTASSVTWTLDERGMPFEEQHRDSQGMSILRRSYRHDAEGRLLSFKGNLGERLRGILYQYDYDRKGRLKERRAYSASTLEPVWVTQFDTDFESGRVVERREIMDRLPLRGNSVTGFGFDPRRALKYRWRFSGDLADLFWKPYDGQGNEGFFDARRRHKIHPKGWLNERLSQDKDGQTVSREFWDWDRRGPLLRYDFWGKPGQEAESLRFDYEFDGEGNWTVMRQFGATEPKERKLEYYQD
jgi:YD repeat-containing protein